MKNISLYDILNILEGSLINGNLNTIVKNAAYALWGIKRDNTMYIHLNKKSIENLDPIKEFKNMVVVTDEPEIFLTLGDDISVVKVDNIKVAFWKFVEYYRSLWQIPVVCITGTSGKTTTTEMIKHILSKRYNIHSTIKGNNSSAFHLSYLLGINESTEVAVFETAVGAPGDITSACKFFNPTIGIITNIAVAHLDGCKTPEAYINAKAEMLTGLKEDGCLIINSDDENTRKIGVDKYMGKKIYFGINNPSDFQGSNIEYADNGMKFILTFNNFKYKAFIPVFGMHEVYNALSAIASTHELGVEIKESIEQLKTFKNLSLHMQFSNGINNCLIINDTWNLTPLSLSAAFKTLNEISQDKKKVAFIGKIQRLGNYSVEIIDQITDMMMKQPVDILIVTGPTAEMISKQLIKKGTKSKVYSFLEPTEALTLLKKVLDKDTILLVKCHMHDSPFKEFFKNLY